MRVLRLIPLTVAAFAISALPAQAIDLNPLSAISGVIEAAVEDRAAGDIGTDSRIKAEFTSMVLDKMGSDVISINADVYEQTVLLTGSIETTTQRSQAASIARSIDGVKRIYNEILVVRSVDKKKGAVEGSVDDTVIETKIKAQFMDAQSLSMTNFRWRSVQGHVVLFGRALSQSELNKAVSIVKHIKNVQTLTNRVFVRALKK